MRRQSRFALLLVGIAACLCFAGPAHLPAQGWVLNADVGQTLHELAPAGQETLGVTMGLRFVGARWFYAAGGLPLGEGGIPWGALGLGARLRAAVGPVLLGADVGAHGHGYRDGAAGITGGGGVLEALPLLAFGDGPLSLEVRSGLQHFRNSHGDEVLSRRVHLSDARLTVGSPRLRLSGEGIYMRAEEADYPYAGVALQTYLGPAVVFGHAGRWFSDAIDTPSWGLGARMDIGGRMDLHAGYYQETVNPLYLNAPRQSWSIGVSRRLGAAAALVGLPSSPVAVVEPSGVTFRLPLSAAAVAPSVAGDFTGWEPVPMVRAGDYWSLTIPVAPGVYSFVFRREDGSWFVPDGVPSRDDGMGGTSAVLVVP